MALFKLHVPILDDIKEKGVKKATLDTIDDSVERLTAGLRIADIRGVLRGDPAPRPNPRIKPHADGFWMHMRPTFFHNKVMTLYPTFRLGWLSVYFLVFETITGIFLMIFYTPSPLVAFEDMLNILGNVPLGQFMRDLHRLGAEGMVLVVCLHMLRTFITGSYKKPRQFTWFTGVVLLLVTLFLSFSGYLLPWDQLALWAVTIGASMVEAIPPPEVGAQVNLLVRGAPQFGAGGLLRFYLLHVLALPAICFIFTGVHYYKVILHGHSLPPEAEEVGEDTARRVPMDQRSYFLPDVFTREMFLIVLTTFLLIFAVTVGDLFHATLEPHADPLVTPLHTTAPWYFLWLQGMLKLGDKVFWGLIAPGIIFNFLFVLPYIEVGPSRRYIDRRIGLSACALTMIVLAILTFMGTPFYGVSSSADQEVFAHLIPETHPGPIRAAGYEVVDDGTYELFGDHHELSFELRELMHVYEHEIEKYQKRGELLQAEGNMVVEPWGVDLKRITLNMSFYDEIEDGLVSRNKSIYLHANSNYEE